jgi:DtxR family Mn-dependent transcriptional regulator
MTGYSQSVEDYLEALYVIGLEQKVVRVKDVAQALNVTMPSVVAAVRTLSEKGLAEQEKYGHIELTAKGEAVAKEIYARHQMLYAFFSEILGLDPKVAEEDACRMEHYLSPEARERIMKMVEFIRSCRDEKVQFLERFMRYVESGERSFCKGCLLTD